MVQHQKILTISQLEKNVDVEAVSFGLSVLHAKIRLFETVLHIAYKLPVKKWQLRTDSEKTVVKEKKKEIQEKIRRDTGQVDVPKPGFGNTNDGNTSRRFLANTELASKLTGVDYNLIYRLKVILEVISSGHKADLHKFSSYCFETAKLQICEFISMVSDDTNNAQNTDSWRYCHGQCFATDWFVIGRGC